MKVKVIGQASRSWVLSHKGVKIPKRKDVSNIACTSLSEVIALFENRHL